LEFSDADDGVEYDPEEDPKTVMLWSNACKSLSVIVLHGREWKMVHGHGSVHE